MSHSWHFSVQQHVPLRGMLCMSCIRTASQPFLSVLVPAGSRTSVFRYEGVKQQASLRSRWIVFSGLDWIRHIAHPSFRPLLCGVFPVFSFLVVCRCHTTSAQIFSLLEDPQPPADHSICLHATLWMGQSIMKLLVHRDILDDRLPTVGFSEGHDPEPRPRHLPVYSDRAFLLVLFERPGLRPNGSNSA